ncbi:MAG: protein kinase [Clostridia bacterium]|nr:protein kinase [Clostridia bacterium]
MGDIAQFCPLWGEWEVDSKLGTGSYGTVWKMRRRLFNGKEYFAAVKHISIPYDESEVRHLLEENVFADDESAVNYFQQVLQSLVIEIDAMHQLRGYTNIVSYEDHKIIQKDSGIGYDIFLRMELLTPLTEKLRAGMSLEDIVKLGIDISTAIEILNKHGLIHRDIKPQNIFINDTGDYKLGDYGTARALQSEATAMSRKGTYNYMAPEVYKSKQADSRVDIYSLGIVLYRLLNRNRHPFLPQDKEITNELNDRALQRRIQGESLPQPIDADPELARIVLKACAFQPEDRYANASELKQDLLRYKENRLDIEQSEQEELDKTISEAQLLSRRKNRRDSALEKPQPKETKLKETDLLEAEATVELGNVDNELDENLLIDIEIDSQPNDVLQSLEEAEGELEGEPEQESVDDEIKFDSPQTDDEIAQEEYEEENQSAAFESMAEVRVNCCDENGKLLRYRIFKIPYGTASAIEAEDVDGYFLISAKTKEVKVDTEGKVDSPVKFTYRKKENGDREEVISPVSSTDEKDDSSENRNPQKIMKLLLILVAHFVLYWIIMCLLSMSALGNFEYEKAKKYMDLTPLFSTVFKSTYDKNELMRTQRERRNETNTSTTDTTAGDTSITETPTTDVATNEKDETILTVSTGVNNIYIGAGEITHVKFIAPSAGTYAFTSLGNAGVYAYLYDSSTATTEIAHDDAGGSDHDFNLEYTLQANQTIYLSVKYFNFAKSGRFQLSITKKTEPAATTTPVIDSVTMGTNNISIMVGETKRVKFVAPSAGSYVFTSVGTDDTYVYLYRSAKSSDYFRSDDNSGTDQNFEIVYTMSEKQAIYLDVKFTNAEKSGTIVLAISPKVNRTFELNSTVSSEKGCVTVSWTDSENKSPYTVLYQYVGNSDVVQPNYWASGQEEGSKTNSKSYTIGSLIPGKTYRIEVRDRDGTSINRTYELPAPATFVDGKLKASSINTTINPRQKDYGAADISSSSISALRASNIVSNRGAIEYGFRYSVSYPQLAYDRQFFTQIAITAPNGYVECEVYWNNEFEAKYSGYHWYMLGDWTFSQLYELNATIPKGTWKVDLYWDGMHVNQNTFEVQ